MSPRRLAPLAGLLLVLTSCGNEPGSPPEDGSGASGGDGSQESPEIREYEARAVPEGSGGDTADDVNGDGFADLLFLTDYDADHPDTDQMTARNEFRRLMVVYGSAEGLDPATRTVLPPQVVQGVSTSGRGGPRRAGTADLDGDGFADVPVRTGPPTDLIGGESEHSGGAAVVWGGPTGPDPDAEPTPLPVSADEEWGPAHLPPVAGDFDGDGAADLAVAQESALGTDGSLLRVLYGPFDRDGAPARTARRPLDGWLGDLVPEPVPEDGGPTRLLVRWGDDGEQPRNTLLVTGPGDPAAWGEADLRAGALAAFGDLDGDGGTDLAIADDGSRNNEPGYETEAPEVDHRVNVYADPTTASPGDPVSGDLPVDGGSAGSSAHGLAACDLDGDGRGELAVGMHGLGVDLVRVADGGIEVDADARLVRRGPEDGPLNTDPGTTREARVFSCADFDADGSDELVLEYGPGPEDASPVRWWVTDGAGDESSFDSAAFTS
ncbi:VCBS repeat-containing protein [Nocardiopsis aegyptia]|uniref:VCBS repeat-containing protein n=1 Tax=Nocardiopsis aegyptia TaxID=220378 RepID=UPI00366B8FE3